MVCKAGVTGSPELSSAPIDAFLSLYPLLSAYVEHVSSLKER